MLGPRFATLAVVDMANVEYVFPAACPECRSVQGMPFKGETTATGAVRIRLRCHLCRYEWELEMSEGQVAIGPKPDRRQLG